MSVTNFVSYSNATNLMTAIGNKFKALAGAFIPKGSVTFANIPATPTSAELGYVYNITDPFTTDARFVEGAGNAYPAGTNIAIVDVGTAGSPDIKYDVMAGFIDVAAITAKIADVSAMIAAEFDTATNYAIGDMCVYQGDLYKFTSAHTAGAWASGDVAQTTVDDLIDALDARITALSGTVDNVEDMVCDNEFDGTQAYAIGDIVTHEKGLYKFKAAHTAGDPWSPSEVDAVSAVDLISSAEPDELTSAQETALIALLG